MASTDEDEALVHEVVGPSLHPREAVAVIAVGVMALNIAGVAPVLLGALQDEHRLSAAGIGLSAMLELITMGVATGLCGALLRPERLRLIGVLGLLSLGVVDIVSAYASGISILALRTAAGVPEGVLIWITVGMIARSQTPERWAGVYFTFQVLAQLVLAGLFFVWILPKFGATGGLWTLGLTTLISLPFALALPPRYGALLQADGLGGGPPPRGWAALLATAVFVSANGAVQVYLQPIAHQAGLSASVTRLALVASLVAQVGGGTSATFLAGKVRYIVIFSICTVAFLSIWALYAFNIPAWAFVGATALSGVFALWIGPFLTPMTIDADPSRRTAMQSAGAQILGAALGPLAASFLVSDTNVRAVLALAAGALVTGFAMMFAIFITAKR